MIYFLFGIGWISITGPILLAVGFVLLKPIITLDDTGISMLVITLILAILDIYIGIKLFDNIIEPWLKKWKR
ncbi:hypothetical protein [Bacillus badius]|uniref:hypothetical protein n=1 Tax=Bacillus badius TaxID=1455 RepID=UPI000597B012|nr:hypothetical protein [Bacillus badius]KZO00903.1 hypothetical protein A4244_14400 [Bacillus badius]MED0668037.1 hypothetical protein [Bacillus badius]MED4717549.1 hypothetical protein [Bacillus badius]OCS88867.1 hypothetical protein A6M11_14420 [Bacillus badius]OVE47560.1 hypothetical protein B1A98_18525 [Bacillus badius]